MQFITNVLATDWVVLYFYFVPIGICLIGASLKTRRELQNDLKRRESMIFYMPTVRVGTLIGRIILIFLPVANFFYGLYLLFSELTPGFMAMFVRVCNTPLVSPKERKEDGDNQ